MAYSRINYVGNGSTTQFSINFQLGFLSRADVTCHVIGEVDGLGNQLYRTLTWINDGLVSISGTAPATGTTVVFERTVDKDALVHDYSDGASIVEENLDQSNKQNIMLVHEVLDGRLGVLQNDLDFGQYTAKNLADPVDDQDAVNLQYFEANNALVNLQGALAAQVAAEAAQDAAEAAQAIADADATLSTTNKNLAIAAATSASNDADATAADRVVVAADTATVTTKEANVVTLAAAVVTNAGTVATNTATVVADAAQVAADRIAVASDTAATHADKLAADADASAAAASAAAAAASAAAVNLPSAAGHGLDYIRQKVTVDGFEYRTPAQVLSDIGGQSAADVTTALTTVYTKMQKVLDAAISAIILADINGSNAAGVYGRVAVDDFSSDTLGASSNYDSTNARYKTVNYTARQTSASGVSTTNMVGTTVTVSTLTDGTLTSQGYTADGSGSRIAMLFGTTYTFGRLRFYNLANAAKVQHFKIVYTTNGGSSWSDGTITAWNAGCSQYNTTQATAVNASGWVDVSFTTPSTANGVGIYVLDVYNAGADYNAGIPEMEVYSVSTANPTWVTQTFTLQAQPTDVHAYLVVKDVVSVTNGTDRTVEASIDAGSTYAAAASYTLVGAAGTDIVMRASFDVSAQTGTSLKLRVKGFNSKEWEWAEHATYSA